MFSIVNVTEDNGNPKAAPIRALKENLKSRSVVRLWSVAPGHLFYIIEGDGSLHTCSLYSALPPNVKQTTIPLGSEAIKLVSAGCGYVVVAERDSCLHVLKHTPEESWTSVGNVKLPSGEPVIDVSVTQNRHLFWTRQEDATASEVSCSLWRCSVSLEDCRVTGVSCLAHRLPTHALYSLGASTVVLPTVSTLANALWTFDERNTFALYSFSRQLLSSTFDPPLDASAVYRRHIRLWRRNDETAEVLDVCTSQLGNRLYVLLRDGRMVSVDASNPHPQTVRLELGIERPVAFYVLGPVVAVLGTSGAETYDAKFGGKARHGEPLEAKPCGALPFLGGFWSETGVHRLCLREDERERDCHAFGALQSRALALCSPQLDSVGSRSIEVRTKLHRILQPLVDCYEKLRATREALVV